MILYLDLKRWIALEVPKVEDGQYSVTSTSSGRYVIDRAHFWREGNNFGVEVQAHVLEKIGSSNRACQRLHEIPRSHFNDRMELGRTWNRFPNLRDHGVSSIFAPVVAPVPQRSNPLDFLHM